MSLDDFLVPDGLNPRSKKDFLFNGVAVSTIPGTHLGPNILAEAARLSKEDKEVLQDIATKNRMSLSSYVRTRILNKNILQNEK